MHLHLGVPSLLEDDMRWSIAAGPKLRKWYGEGERKQGGKDKRDPQGEQDEPGDAILVTDADSPIGELVLLQLILARQVTTFLSFPGL